MSELFTWGVKGAPDYLETPTEQIPANSHHSLGLRGYRHVLGNEVAAQKVAFLKTDEGKAMDESQVAAWVIEKRAEKLARILDGTLGVRTAATPRVSGIEAVRAAINLDSLKVFLKKNNLKMPTGEGTIKVAGRDMTREDLLAANYRRAKATIDAETDRAWAFKTGEADAESTVEDLFAEESETV